MPSPATQPFKPRVCIVCGTQFTPHSTRAKTCSPACSAEYHRLHCLEKAREAAFLRPYDIEAYLAKHPEADPSRQAQAPDPVPPSPPTPPPPPRTPEPTTNAQRQIQRDSVLATMSLPPSQRYQHSRIWSDFQRLFAISIEKQRIDDHFSSPTLFNAYRDDPPEPPPPQPLQPKPPRRHPSRPAHTVPTLPPRPAT